MRPLRLVFFMLFSVLGMSIPAFSQGLETILSIHPSVAIPVGPVDNGRTLYEIGGGGSLRGEFVPTFANWLFGTVSLDYDYLPLNGSPLGASFVSGGASAGVSYSPVPRISLKASTGGGLYAVLLESGTARNPFVDGGVGIQFRLSPTLSLGLGGRYRHMFVPAGALYQGVSVDLGLSYNMAGSKAGTGIRVAPSLSSVFPLFYSYYNEHPMGALRIVNEENIPMERVEVSFYAKQFMDAPRLCGAVGSLYPGQPVDVPVFALFNDEIFKVTEGTKAAGELVVTYYYLGRATTKTVPVTVQVQNRNAMTWDDDRKAAAFVTAKDPLVLSFAKGISSMARSESSAISVEFRSALGVFQGLKIYGLGYVIDPSTPFSSTSATDTAIDFLQFPNQTLSYRAGDCDDISILFCALLEAIGIETAFITVPGHIYMAFDSGLEVDAARKAFSGESEFIPVDGKAWIPVEITLVKDGFMRAWATGAGEWRKASAEGAAAMYRVREAWKLYEPVGFSQGTAAAPLPSQEALQTAFRSEMDRVARAQISTRVEAFQSQIAAGRDLEKNYNKLGILYAQFGLIADARDTFLQIVAKKEYVPALVNLGNVEYLAGATQKAVDYFGRALKAMPGNAPALLGLALCLQQGDDSASFKAAVANLAAVSPSVAESNFPSVAQEQRAADLEIREVKVWTE